MSYAPLVAPREFSSRVHIIHCTGENRHVPIVSQHSFHTHSGCRMNRAACVAQEPIAETAR